MKEGKATIEEIATHLAECQAHTPAFLQDKIDITKYAEKICEHSVTYEAWMKGRLVGLVAAYQNRESFGFITNVSVSEGFTELGIASALIDLCIEDAVRNGIGTLKLEVSKMNNMAIDLYSRRGFKVTNEGENPMLMVLSISEGA